VARSLLRNLLGGVTARVTFDDYVDVLVLLATKLLTIGTMLVSSMSGSGKARHHVRGAAIERAEFREPLARNREQIAGRDGDLSALVQADTITNDISVLHIT